jgi:hypothetical protein
MTNSKRTEVEAIIVSMREAAASRKATVLAIAEQMQISQANSAYYVDRAFKHLKGEKAAKAEPAVVVVPTEMKWTIRDNVNPGFVLETRESRAKARAQVANYKTIWPDTTYKIAFEAVPVAA